MFSTRQKTKKDGKLMAANKLVLKNDQVEVEYTPEDPAAGATPTSGLALLVYRDGGSAPKSFTGSQVATDQTGLGTLVSVALATSVDTGGERFGFFLPQLDVPAGEFAEFRTAAVYEKGGGCVSILPDSGPRRDPSWRCVELYGTAHSLIMEL
jgi:hypothetical protein